MEQDAKYNLLVKLEHTNREKVGGLEKLSEEKDMLPLLLMLPLSSPCCPVTGVCTPTCADECLAECAGERAVVLRAERPVDRAEEHMLSTPSASRARMRSAICS